MLVKVPSIRLHWRRLTAKSWLLSRWYYRHHKIALPRTAPASVWYFAYGSNMHESAFIERRGMRPIERRAGRVKGYRLRFNLDGRPKGKAAPANIAIEPEAEVWGVLYKITGRDMLRLNLSEGVPGKRYRPIWLNAEDGNGEPFVAFTYVAEGNAEDGRPSLRYITLLREGAKAHGLPEAWLKHLHGIEHAQ